MGTSAWGAAGAGQREQREQRGLKNPHLMAYSVSWNFVVNVVAKQKLLK